jgi:hypothetical protein
LILRRVSGKGFFNTEKGNLGPAQRVHDAGTQTPDGKRIRFF